MQPTAGRSLSDIFQSDKSGRVNPERDHVLIGKERHDIGRPNDWGYPVRGIVRQGMLYLRNFEPSRWPSGNPETGYLNCDGSPTKTAVLQGRTSGDEGRRHWRLCFGKRPEEELYDIKSDPDCTKNLADREEHKEAKEALRRQLFAALRGQEDPRIFGQGSVFDNFPYADERLRGFYERYMRGEPLQAGWVNESDFEKAPVEE